MIQQLCKINLLATSAMLITFSASLFLVTFITPRKTWPVKSLKTVTSRLTSQQSSPPNPYYGPFEPSFEGLNVEFGSPMRIDRCSPLMITTTWMEECPEVTHR